MLYQLFPTQMEWTNSWNGPVSQLHFLVLITYFSFLDTLIKFSLLLHYMNSNTLLKFYIAFRIILYVQLLVDQVKCMWLFSVSIFYWCFTLGTSATSAPHAFFVGLYGSVEEGCPEITKIVCNPESSLFLLMRINIFLVNILKTWCHALNIGGCLWRLECLKIL